MIQPPTPDAEARARCLAMAPEPREPEEVAPMPPMGEFLETLKSKVRTDEESREWAWKNETMPRMAEVGFEKRYQTRVEFSGRQLDAMQHCERLCTGTGAIIALVGPRGTGKTTITAQMARRRIERCWPNTSPQHYGKLVALIARYKAIYSDYGTIEGDLLTSARDAYCKIPLVFIDEIHEADDSRLKSKILTDILDRRYAALKDTIIICNQTADEFQETIGSSILSRMHEHGSLIECDWENFRQRQA